MVNSAYFYSENVVSIQAFEWHTPPCGLLCALAEGGWGMILIHLQQLALTDGYGLEGGRTATVFE